MTDFGTRSPVGENCTKCGQPTAKNMRRCPACGEWQRPWSVGGKPERWAKYDVGGSGRPDEYGAGAGRPGEVQSSVWVRWGPNGEYVRQSTPDGKPAPSGAHAKGGVKKRRGK